MAFDRSPFIRSLMLGASAAVVGVLALSGCSSSGSATAPATTAPATTTTSPSVPTTAVPSSVSVTPGPGVAATDPPESKTPPSPAQTQPAQASASPQASGLPLDTKLYPPPNVPRTAAKNSTQVAYLKSLQDGGLTVTASGSTELNIGNAICGELAHGSKESDMRPLLVTAGGLAVGLGKSKLTGEQAADLYLSSAKANLC